VFGLEAQGNWADLSGSNVSQQFPAFRNHTNVDAFGLFTGQVGYAVNNVLLYVKGGAAVTANSYRSTLGGIVANAGDDTRWGGTIGAGLEYAFAPNWSVGVEYNHLFMQDRTYNFTTPGGLAFGTDRIRQDVDLVTARLNYRFGGPSISKY
jgi:outer membrane immunogenic protein